MQCGRYFNKFLPEKLRARIEFHAAVNRRIVNSKARRDARLLQSKYVKARSYAADDRINRALYRCANKRANEIRVRASSRVKIRQFNLRARDSRENGIHARNRVREYSDGSTPACIASFFKYLKLRETSSILMTSDLHLTLFSS